MSSERSIVEYSKHYTAQMIVLNDFSNSKMFLYTLFWSDSSGKQNKAREKKVHVFESTSAVAISCVGFFLYYITYID